MAKKTESGRVSKSSTERKTKGKRSAGESKWGEYLRQIKKLPFVDKGNRVSWWGLPKRSASFGMAEMPYLPHDHNLDDASLLPEIGLSMLCQPLLSTEMANAGLLENWLLQYCRVEETHVVKRKLALRDGPLRDESALGKAVVNLASLNRARWIKIGERVVAPGRMAATHIQVNSMLLAGRV